MRKTSVTVSKWCAGIVSILGMILYICSAIFFYRFLQIDYKWADGIGWPGMIEYGLIFIILAIVLIYMHRVTRQYLRSNDNALCMDSVCYVGVANMDSQISKKNKGRVAIHDS